MGINVYKKRTLKERNFINKINYGLTDLFDPFARDPKRRTKHGAKQSPNQQRKKEKSWKIFLLSGKLTPQIDQILKGCRILEHFTINPYTPNKSQD
jgi:hypothetical protein